MKSSASEATETNCSVAARPHAESEPRTARAWAPGMLAMGMLLSAATPARASTSAELLWAANNVGQYRGKAGCQAGDPACNRCVHDVEASFDRLDSSAVSISGKSVFPETPIIEKGQLRLFNPTRLPADKTIERFAGFPWQKSHFQGFTRVDYNPPITELGSDKLMPGFGAPSYWPSPRDSTGNWYAHSFGEFRPSGITLSWQVNSFFPSVPDKTRNSAPIFYFAAPDDAHVGGIHAVGKYLLAAIDQGDERTHVAVLDLSRPLEMRWAQGQGVEKIPIGSLKGDPHMDPQRASSVAAVQLFDGSYLVAVQERSVFAPWRPLEPDLSKHDYSVYRVASLDDTTKGVTMLSRPFDIPMAGADNLAALTECGTGQVYLVASGGDDTGKVNYWSLLRVTPGGGLTKVDSGNKHSPEYDDDNCQARAAGSAFPNERGQLVAACIEKHEGDGIDRQWDWQEWTVAPIGGIVQE